MGDIYLKKYILRIILLYSFFTVLLGSCTNYADEKHMRNEQYLKYDSCCSMILSDIPRSEALRYARLAVNIAEALADDNMKVNSYIDISRILYLLNQYENALNYAHKAITIGDNIGDSSAIYEAKRICGAIYTDIGNEKNAQKYLNESLDYYEYNCDTFGIIKTLGTKAILLGRKNNYDECIDLLDSIYLLSFIHKDYKSMLTTRLNIINACGLVGNKSKCLNLIDSVFYNIPVDYITDKDRLAVKFYRGELLYYEGNFDNAKLIFSDILQEANKYNSYEIMLSSFDYLVELAKRENNYKLVSELLSEKISLKDSVQGIDIQQKIAEMEIIYEVANKNSEISKLVLNNKLSLQRIILISLFIIIIIVVIVVRIYMKAKISSKEKQMLVKDLEMKHKQLTNMAIYFYEHKNFIDDLYADINKISSYNNINEIRKDLRNISSKMNNGSIIDIKEKIYTYIDTSYYLFIERIGKKYPELTSSEKRICAMLLVDFSTKDISEVLHISDKSINNIRSKIRKKMSIPDNVSMSDFLRQI